MNNFTFSDFKKLTEDEAKLSSLIKKKSKDQDMRSPSQQTVNSILAYSKAISVKKSEQMDFIENVLN